MCGCLNIYILRPQKQALVCGPCRLRSGAGNHRSAVNLAAKNTIPCGDQDRRQAVAVKTCNLSKFLASGSPPCGFCGPVNDMHPAIFRRFPALPLPYPFEISPDKQFHHFGMMSVFHRDKFSIEFVLIGKLPDAFGVIVGNKEITCNLA